MPFEKGDEKMIFYFNASGDSIGTSPERVYQGSNKANKLYVVCPIPRNAVVSVTYELPNGETSASFIMNSVMLENHKEMVDKYGITFNMWEVSLEEIASAYCGCVGVQFTFNLSSGEVLKSSYQRFYVERGIEVEEPEKGDSYQEILTFLSALNSRLVNVEDMTSQNASSLDGVSTAVSTLQEKVGEQSTKIEANESSISRLQSEVKEVQNKASENAESVSKLKKEVAFVSNVVNETMIGTVEVSDCFSNRITAGGLNVINGTPTQVFKVYGNTVEGEDGNFQDACFYGIDSYSANKFKLKDIKINSGGKSVVTTNMEDNTISINGYVQKNETVATIRPNMPAGISYSMKFEHLGGNATDSTGNPVNVSINVFMIGLDYDKCLYVNQDSPFSCGVVGYDGKDVIISFVVNNREDIVFNDYKFRVMIVEGEYGETDMLKFSPYAEPERFCLAESVSLGEYDYIDFVEGNLVRQTGYVVKETPLTEEEIALYPNATTSSNGKQLFYKTSQKVTTPLDTPKSYVVYSGGREKVICDEEGNENLMTKVIVRQKYLVKVGG